MIKSQVVFLNLKKCSKSGEPFAELPGGAAARDLRKVAGKTRAPRVTFGGRRLAAGPPAFRENWSAGEPWESRLPQLWEFWRPRPPNQPFAAQTGPSGLASALFLWPKPKKIGTIILGNGAASGRRLLAHSFQIERRRVLFGAFFRTFEQFGAHDEFAVLLP